MANSFDIYQYCINCIKCEGTGKIKIIIRWENKVPIYEEITCRVCKGIGKILWGTMDKE